MKKSMDSLYQENTSKKLDERILKKASLLLAERRALQPSLTLSRAFLTFATAASLILIVFSTHNLNNFTFSHSEVAEIESSPLVAYTELNLDLMHDQDLIEQDLNLLAENDYEID